MLQNWDILCFERNSLFSLKFLLFLKSKCLCNEIPVPGFSPSCLPRIDFPFSIFMCKFAQWFSFKFIYFFGSVFLASLLFIGCASRVCCILLSAVYLGLFPPFLAGFILSHMPAFSAASEQSLILTLVIFCVTEPGSATKLSSASAPSISPSQFPDRFLVLFEEAGYAWTLLKHNF